MKEEDIEQKRQAGRRKGGRGESGRLRSSTKNKVVPDPHLTISKGSAGSSAKPEEKTAPVPVSEDGSDDFQQPVQQLPSVAEEESAQPANSIPFVSSCFVACVACSVFWLTVFLSIWYFSK